jgi:predicted ATP-grasp superfamily ATP-dependent carboligase
MAAGLWSRYAAARAVGPDAIGDPHGFARAVADVAERHGPLVVYPGQDEALNALLAPEAALPEEALLPYPGPEVLAAVRDKGRVADLATAAGLATPATLAVGRAGELAAAGLPDGAVVKSTHPGGAFPAVHVADSRDELRALLAKAPAEEELMLQERVTGRLMAVAVVLDRDGALVRRFQQRSLRTWPEHAGISSLAVSVEPDESLVDASRSLLSAAGYWGIAQLQFLDSPAGPRLIDVNTRFYGSLALALAAGVDLPGAWHAVALQRPAGRPAPYRAGVSYRWLEADLMAAMHGRPQHLLSRVPRPRTGPMWARDDPAASAVFAASALGGPLARRLRRR